MGRLLQDVRGSRLGALLGETALAVEQGRLTEALRFADSACRFAPADQTCLLLYCRLLIQAGAVSEVIERLRGREDADCILARAEALCVDGSLDEAASSMEKLLHTRAVDSVNRLREFAFELCLTQEQFPGWVGIDTNSRVVGGVRSGSRVAFACAGRVVLPIGRVIDGAGIDSFECTLPKWVSGRVKVCTGDLRLLGSDFTWPPDFGLYGWVAAECRELVGKVRLDWAPALPLTLAVAQKGAESIRIPVPPVGSSATESLFSIPLNLFAADAERVEVSVRLPDGRHTPLVGSPVTLQPLSPVSIAPRRERTFAAACCSRQLIDIVVPVYAGREETLACLEQVLVTTARSDAELIVVNDASPDLKLCEALGRLALDGCVTLLTNQSNLGFPGSANRGMSLHVGRDVVLLNSDTEIFGDWLTRLRSAAYSQDDIGTVTPLGESASIMSYPGRTESVHPRNEVGQIDQIAREVNARQLVELPVGVGFCMYIKRACLSDVGAFDEHSFARGYGEENDFCLRARRLGWRHMGAADVFVGHRGGRSYGRMKEALIERNHRVLNALHPGYDAMIAGFVAADPLLDARRAIDIGRLLQVVRNPVLLITLDLPGGVKRHVDDRESQLHNSGHTVLIMRPSETPGEVILTTRAARLENLSWTLPKETSTLRALLSALKLLHIELHHFVGLPAAALDLLTSLSIPYDVYIHDYAWVCPRVTLLSGDGTYCGEPPVEECEICIRSHGTALEESLTVAALRTRSAQILRGASKVIAPSNDTRARLARYFPGLEIAIRAWEAPITPRNSSGETRGTRVRVAVIGSISVQKGSRVLLECAADAATREIDLEFVVIGYTCDDDSLLATGRVFITGPWAENEIGTLLEREQCHVAFFPSVTPETWCYALSHAIGWGLPVVAFDLGAIAERLQTYAAAELLPLSTPAARINQSLLRLARENHCFTRIEGVLT